MPNDLKRHKGAPGKQDLKRRKQNIHPGADCRGFIVTASNPTRWKEALREIVAICLKLFSDEKTEAECDETSSFTDELAREISGLKERRRAGDFAFAEIARGVGFVAFPKGWSVAPTDCLSAIMEAVSAKEVQATRFTQRITPVDGTCMPNQGAILVAARSLVSHHFPGACDDPQAGDYAWGTQIAAEGDSWRVVMQTRNMSPKKSELLAAVGGMISSERYSVDLENFQLALIIEVNPLFAGLAVVRGYNQYRKFNLMQIQQPDCVCEKTRPQPSQNEEKSSTEGQQASCTLAQEET